MRTLQSRRRVLSWAATAAVGSMGAQPLLAQTFNNTVTIGNSTEIEGSGNFTQGRRISAEGYGVSSPKTFSAYATMDWQANQFASGNLVSNINAFTLNLWDNGLNVTPLGASAPDSFAFAGPVDFYLVGDNAYTGSTASWLPAIPSFGPVTATSVAGVDLINSNGTNGSNLDYNGHVVTGPTFDKLFSLGTLNYVPQPATSGTVGTFTLNFASTLSQVLASNTNLTEAQFIANQVNSGGKLRLLVAPQYSGSGTVNTTVGADFVGTTPPIGVPASAPQLTISGNITAAPTNNAVLNAVVSGTNTKTIVLPTIPRMWRYGNVTNAVTLSVSGDGTNAVRYNANGNLAQFNFSGPTPAPSGTSSGIFSFVGGGGAAGAGTLNYTVTGTLHNIDNPNDSTDINITETAGVLIDSRTVGLQAAGNTFLNSSSFLTVNLNGSHSGVLVGATVGASINLATSNSPSIAPGSNTLSIVRLNGTSVATFNSATGGTATLSAGTADVTYGSGINQDGSSVSSGTEVSTRTLTLLAGSKAGTYIAANKNTGFFTGPTLLNADDPLAVNPASRISYASDSIDYGADIFQTALVTASATNLAGSPLTSRIVLSNAAATSNVSSSEEIGARAAAVVTSVSSATSQAGWGGVTGISAGTVLTPGTLASGTTAATLAAGTAGATATFDPTIKLNGVYSGKIVYGLQTNDQNLAGAAPNDVAPVTSTFSATVSGNTGTGYANVLPGGSYAGYNISRGSGANTSISFLAGTSSANTNLTVGTWADGAGKTLGDRATVTGSGTDVVVIQMSYSGSFTNSINAPGLAYNNGTQFAGTFYNNTVNTGLGKEVLGAYNGSLTVGTYGVDTNRAVVWAVVNKSAATQFAPVDRLTGDATFDGTVDLQDYLTLAQNFHTTNTAAFSLGDFNGDTKVDLQDYLLLAQNFHVSAGGVTKPAAAKAATSAKTLTGAATPAVVVPLGLVDPGVGKLALEIDPTNGHVYLVGNNTLVQAYNADSVAGLFNIAAGKNPYETLKINPTDQASWNVLQAVPQHIAENVTTGTSSEPFAAFGSTSGNYYYDLTFPGSTLWNGTESQISTDLAFDWGDGNLQHHTGQVIDLVPEPTMLSLLGLGGMGLLARRRKQRNSTPNARN